MIASDGIKRMCDEIERQATVNSAVTDDAGRHLRQWLYPDGRNIHPSRASKLRAWLRDRGIAEVSFTFLIRAAGLFEMRLDFAAKASDKEHR